MANEFQGTATLALLHETDMTPEEFLIKFHEDNIIDAKLQITLSDGTVHTLSVCGIVKINMTDCNDEEINLSSIQYKTFEKIKNATMENTIATKKVV
jgi:hypothetical protein